MFSSADVNSDINNITCTCKSTIKRQHIHVCVDDLVFHVAFTSWCHVGFREIFFLTVSLSFASHCAKFCQIIYLIYLHLMYRLLLWWASKMLKVNGFRLVSVTAHFLTSSKMIMVLRVEGLWRIPTLPDLHQQSSISTPWEVVRDWLTLQWKPVKLVSVVFVYTSYDISLLIHVQQDHVI